MLSLLLFQVFLLAFQNIPNYLFSTVGVISFGRYADSRWFKDACCFACSILEFASEKHVDMFATRNKYHKRVNVKVKNEMDIQIKKEYNDLKHVLRNL